MCGRRDEARRRAGGETEIQERQEHRGRGHRRGEQQPRARRHAGRADPGGGEGQRQAGAGPAGGRGRDGHPDQVQVRRGEAVDLSGRLGQTHPTLLRTLHR